MDGSSNIVFKVVLTEFLIGSHLGGSKVMTKNFIKYTLTRNLIGSVSQLS